MKSTILGVGFAAFASIGAGAAGCDGGDAGGETSAEQGGGGSASTGTKPTAGPASGTGGSGGSGHHSFADAAELSLFDTESTKGTLSDPATSKDFYKFTGTKGDRIAIFGTAKTLPTSKDPFDPTCVDLVVTVYDEKQAPIARQDDPWPTSSNDPSLFMVLPSNGTYFIEIDDCNAAYEGGNCSDPIGISKRDYEIRVLTLSGSAIVHEPSEPNDTPPESPSPFAYATGQNGDYVLMLLDGAFSGKNDVDVYAFQPPADADVDPGARPHAEFWIATAGPDGNGATSVVGEVWVERSDAPGERIAWLDNTKFGPVTNGDNGPANLSVPLRLDAGAPDGEATYLLFVKHPGGAAGKNDFFFVQHTVQGGSLLETEPNDAAAAPEDLTGKGEKNADGSFSYFIEGNLTPGVDDTDVFSVPIGSSLHRVTVVCGAMRDGSGLEGFSVSVLTGSTMEPMSSPIVDSEDGDLQLDQAVGTETSVLVALTADSQSLAVSGNYYQCGIHVNP